jgi:hypothetical protein
LFRRGFLECAAAASPKSLWEALAVYYMAAVGEGPSESGLCTYCFDISGMGSSVTFYFIPPKDDYFLTARRAVLTDFLSF